MEYGLMECGGEGTLGCCRGEVELEAVEEE